MYLYMWRYLRFRVTTFLSIFDLNTEEYRLQPAAWAQRSPACLKGPASGHTKSSAPLRNIIQEIKPVRENDGLRSHSWGSSPGKCRWQIPSITFFSAMHPSSRMSTRVSLVMDPNIHLLSGTTTGSSHSRPYTKCCSSFFSYIFAFVTAKW